MKVIDSFWVEEGRNSAECWVERLESRLSWLRVLETTSKDIRVGSDLIARDAVTGTHKARLVIAWKSWISNYVRILVRSDGKVRVRITTILLRLTLIATLSILRRDSAHKIRIATPIDSVVVLVILLSSIVMRR